MKHYILSLCLSLTIASASFFAIQPAHACGTCQEIATAKAPNWWRDTVKSAVDHVDQEIQDLQQWLKDTFWDQHMQPAMEGMANELSAGAIQRVQVIGTFFDAENQIEASQSIQKVRARAHKDYHTSTGICEFGSTTKSLALTERNAELNALFLARRSQDRALGKDGTAAAEDNPRDKKSRVQQFRLKFCDPSDNNSGLNYICDHDQSGFKGKAIASDEPERFNKEIDYLRTVDAPWSLDMNFTNVGLTDEEEEVLALASNLYGHHVFHRPNPKDLIFDEGKEKSLKPKQEAYLDMRALLAKRSVAENSFNAITSMKSADSGADPYKSKEYLEAILAGLDIEDPEKMIGNKNPSYYAQMEVLTKKIYQSPDFYTNLYDRPANVARKEVSLQAIGLMQKFDLFKSYLRHEASLSVLLELAVMELQEGVESGTRTLSSRSGSDGSE